VTGSSGGGAKHAPFRKLGERIVHRGFRLTVAIGEFAGPDGSTFERDVVHHPGAVGVVPLHDDGSVTLIRQYRAPLDAEIWEIPAGLRDVVDEPTEVTARRELVEEAGLRASEIVRLIGFHNSPGFCDEEVVVYLATGLTAVANDLQGVEEEHLVVERVPLGDALAMIDDGQITDAKTVIGLLLTARGEANA
jgi:ADP-ribose pyrophosphatase